VKEFNSRLPNGPTADAERGDVVIADMR